MINRRSSLISNPSCTVTANQGLDVLLWAGLDSSSLTPYMLTLSNVWCVPDGWQ